ncbi:HNH endonuclease [candidate division KSB3 bacterium]|uniref:HNH endonuclease n=1 Tax=candidate division KSB3 bacterium TaxID=2044937 RepID=A0A9D5JY64_9BACT|nr:HNH endonuclease [candidate division KSB3 bacterium]MBD3326290.1 HNH endonuclease [candidate division KSB3 bacterium]
MTSRKLPRTFIEYCKSITAKRAKTVLDHLLKHGQITTEELKDIYGYNHPPRAIRDVRELGIPIETFRVEGSDRRKIAAYRFGDPQRIRFRKLQGRTALSKDLKRQLIEKDGEQCAIYLEVFEESELQIDHRIPYEIAGDNAATDLVLDDFMLLSPSANRAKSWACEHCVNWQELKDVAICKTCYWAYPDNYFHVAMRPIRRIDIIWQGEEVKIYERLKQKTLELQKDIPAYVKEIIEKTLQ